MRRENAECRQRRRTATEEEEAERLRLEYAERQQRRRTAPEKRAADADRRQRRRAAADDAVPDGKHREDAPRQQQRRPAAAEDESNDRRSRMAAGCSQRRRAAIEQRRADALRRQQELRPLAFRYDPQIPELDSSMCDMTEICPLCESVRFRKELHGLCCSAGKAILEALSQLLEVIEELLNANTADSRNIRKYKAAFAMTNSYSARPQERQG